MNLERGKYRDDGFTAALGWEVDQMQRPSVWPEPLGFLRAIEADEVGWGRGRDEGEAAGSDSLPAQDECSWENNRNNSPEKQYRHRPLAGIGCQGPDSIVLLPPWGPDESRPLAAGLLLWPWAHLKESRGGRTGSGHLAELQISNAV